MKNSLQNILLEIHNKEDKISSQSKSLLDEAYEMILYLQDILFSVKKSITQKGFNDEAVNTRQSDPHSPKQCDPLRNTFQ